MLAAFSLAMLAAGGPTLDIYFIAEQNFAPDHIANRDETTAPEDGSFQVSNVRTGQSTSHP
jgi:hypothetical protein